jgi:hypothetical protein
MVVWRRSTRQFEAHVSRFRGGGGWPTSLGQVRSVTAPHTPPSSGACLVALPRPILRACGPLDRGAGRSDQHEYAPMSAADMAWLGQQQAR